MESKIMAATALLTDPNAMADFLSPIPNGDLLGTLLMNGAPVSTRAYEDDTDTARFVVSDGKTAQCFTVKDITIDQAEMIAAECVDIQWSASAFQGAVERALGADFARHQ